MNCVLNNMYYVLPCTVKCTINVLCNVLNVQPMSWKMYCVPHYMYYLCAGKYTVYYYNYNY